MPAHIVLGALSLIPFVGVVPGIVDAYIYAVVDRDYFSAMISVFGAISMGAGSSLKFLSLSGKATMALKCVMYGANLCSNSMIAINAGQNTLKMLGGMYEKYVVNKSGIDADTGREVGLLFLSGVTIALSVAGIKSSATGIVNSLADDVSEASGKITNKYISESADEVERAARSKTYAKAPAIERSKVQRAAFAICFTEGTRIKTEHGDKAIEEIQIGDKVYAKDTETGETGYKPVVTLFQNETETLIRLEIGDESIETTPGHPFYVEGYGFKLAGELCLGDMVESQTGESYPVEKAEWIHLEEPIRVYNFEVADWHTYHVTELGLLVHNECESGTNASNYTYRALNQKDYDRYTNGLGLEAKNPNGSWSLKEHLVDGSGKLSWVNDPYISTTSDLSVAKGFNQSGRGYGIVKIDMNKVTSPSYRGYEIYPRVNGKEGLPYHYSVWQQETSVYQSIPFEAIVDYLN